MSSQAMEVEILGPEKNRPLDAIARIVRRLNYGSSSWLPVAGGADACLAGAFAGGDFGGAEALGEDAV